jgi:hypothetical protein
MDIPTNHTEDELNKLKDVDTLTQQFTKFGEVATKALQGIGEAALIAAQNNTTLAEILQKATTAASADSAKNLSARKLDNTLQLKEAESFEQSILDIKKRYNNLVLDDARSTAAEKQRIVNAEFAAAKQGADALMALADLMIENGRKNTDIQKANALIKIGIDTARAISSLVAASNENPANAPTSGIAGIIQFATGIAGIITNIAKAKDILDGGSASGTSGSPNLGSSAPAINTSAPVIPSPPRETPAAMIDRETGSNTRQQGMIKAYVVESEITKSQQRAASLRNQAMH